MQEKQYTKQSHSYPHENDIDYDALPDIAGADGLIMATPHLIVGTYESKHDWWPATKKGRVK